MPRAADGTYTLPTPNSWVPAVDGQEIDTADLAALLGDIETGLNTAGVPAGISVISGRGSDGEPAAYAAGDGITIDGDTLTISVTAIVDDDTQIPVIGTGGTYTVTAADRDLSTSGTSLVSKIMRVRNTTLSNPVVITLPASSTITGEGDRFNFLVASDQTGAVTFVPASGGTINGGTSPIQARGTNSAVTIIVDSNPGSAPVMTLLGDTTEDKTIAGNITFSGGVTFQGTAISLDADIPKTASFTFAAIQDQRVTAANHATVAIVGTIPPYSDVPWREGAVLVIEQRGAAAASFAQGAGVTINKPSGLTLVAAGQYYVISARHTATTNTWTASGGLGT